MNAPYYTNESATIWHGDCLEVLRDLPDNSVDAVVTDPPYSLSFMSARWDTHATPAAFQQWCQQWATECLRVMKPGAHLLAFGGTRTWHRLTCAIEDAGFEIRDNIADLGGGPAPTAGLVWLHGQGFSKGRDFPRLDYAANGDHENAAKWAGWNVALKPAFEPVVVARKPLAGTIAQNVLQWGTGALNVDGARVAHRSDADRAESEGKNQHTAYANPGSNRDSYSGNMPPRRDYDGSAGRWPPNVVLDGHAAAELDEQSGTTRSTVRRPTGRDTRGIPNGNTPVIRVADTEQRGTADEGGASRFFPVFKYQAKAPTRERPKVDGVAHPTCKPLALMRWLVRLVTPPGGVVLDPFAGSGTTGEACALEGFRATLVERETAYLPLIVARLSKPTQGGLFAEGAP